MAIGVTLMELELCLVLISVFQPWSQRSNLITSYQIMEVEIPRSAFAFKDKY